MTYRDNWKFEYSIADLKAAALTKEAWHASRLEFWLNKNDEVMTKIKQDGIEISESVAQSYSNSDRNAQVLIRSDLQVDLWNILNECQNKIHEHKQKLADYQAWVFIFDSQSQTNILELSKDDYLYFYSK